MEPEGGARPQTPSDGNPGWPGRKTDSEKKIQLIGGKSFMVANSSDEGMANSVRTHLRQSKAFFAVWSSLTI